MPGGDRTGPRGLGPMIGRAAGYCSGYDRPEYANSAFGPGMRFGDRFGGRGGRRGGGQGAGFGRGGGGMGRGGGNKPGSGPVGNCVCPKCGHRITHQVGQRCLDLTCPKCGTQMVRE